MADQTKWPEEQTAAVEDGTKDEPHDVLSNDGTMLHAGSEKKRKRAIATRRQVAANRANAALSTGPRTLEGKEITARNAIRHGLMSRSKLLPGDDPSEYEAFADAMKMTWAPQGRQEQELVHQIIDATWRLRRIREMKAGAVQSLMREEVDPTTFADLWNQVTDNLNRYAAAEERTLYHRAIPTLERLQDRRRNSSMAAQLLLAQDQHRTLRELCEKRGLIKLTEVANTKPDRIGDHEAASPRIVSVVPSLKASTRHEEYILRNEAK